MLALAADPQRALDALAEGTLIIDYLETTDQTLNTIPDYSFGRKGEVPYFGNSPIFNGEERVVSQAVTAATVTGETGWATAPLATFAIPASFLTDQSSQNLLLELDLNISYSSLASVDWRICLAFDDELAALQAGFYGPADYKIRPTPTNAAQTRVNLRGFLALMTENRSGKRGLVDALGDSPLVLTCGDADGIAGIATSTFILKAGTDTAVGTGVGAVVGVATNLNVMMIPSVTTAFKSAVVTGRIRLIAPFTITAA